MSENRFDIPTKILKEAENGDTKKKIEYHSEVNSINNNNTNIENTTKNNEKNGKKEKSNINIWYPVSLVSSDTIDTLDTLDTKDTKDTNKYLDNIYNKLETINKILFVLYYHNNKTIKELNEITNINLSTIKNSIYREDRNINLINDGLLELTEQNPNKYSITEKGKSVVNNIIKQYEIQRLEEQTKEQYKSDIITRINVLKEFLNTKYKKPILERHSKGKKWIMIDFNDVLKWNHDIADELLDNTFDTLKAFEVALSEITDANKFSARIYNLPKCSNTKIGDLRSSDLNKICSIDCIIKQTSTVRPKANLMRFECPSCGNIIHIVQLKDHLIEPQRCQCGRKGKFTILSTEFRDFQTLKVEELQNN